MDRKILIAEDDKHIAQLVSLYLESNGFKVSAAENGVEALRQFEEDDFSLVIVDIMMPEMNGYDLIQKIREKANVPVIILSAKNTNADKVLGLDIGADAYITKPFDPLELVANVKAQMRRYYHFGGADNIVSQPGVIKRGDLCIDTQPLRVTRGNETVFLTATEMKILLKLMEKPGQIFTKKQLYECVNGDYMDNDDKTMMVHIFNLRSKIEEDPKQPKYIKTIRGLGYKLNYEE